MKRRITVRLAEQVAARLDRAATHPGASKTAIIEAALDDFSMRRARLSPTPHWSPGSTR